jgi:serine protease AprX
VLSDSAAGRDARFLVVLRAQGDAHAVAASMSGRSARGRAIVRKLRGTAAVSQARVRAELDRLGVDYRPYWIVNALAVDGDRAAVEALARLPEVASIESDRGFDAQTATTLHAAPAKHAAPTGIEWNISRVGAPKLWAIGVTGQGIVYANADSGVVWNHAALKAHYRGWDGATVKHDYNWWDAVHADIDGNGTNPCGFNSPTPCDDDTADSHGTHTMGTAIGDDGAGNQIGVAPGAKWIACHNQDQSTGRPSSYIECLQWFLAPTDLQGRNPNPDLRPNVVGNSYVCPPNELCSEDVLRPAVDAMRAAGIFMSVSAGNEGPSCSTVALPPAPYDSSVSVGASDGQDVIASFSSRGPVTADGSGRAKPDLVAPGVSVRSSEANGYGVLSGTSMASPHVGGAVALLWSAFPDLRGNVDATERLLEETARPLTSAQGCGGNSATAVPNNVYGYGRLDVYAAYQKAETDSPPALATTNVQVAEGTGAETPVTFVVTLARPSTRTVIVAYATRNGTAKAPADFRAATGTLSFAPGERSKSVTVTVVGDAAAEAAESFTLTLLAPSNASVATPTATATITNDDGADRTAPRVTRLRVNGRVLSFTLSEPATTTAKLRRGSRVVKTLARPFGPGPHSLRLPALPPARYVAAVTARDPAGNVGRALRTFRVRSGR